MIFLELSWILCISMEFRNAKQKYQTSHIIYATKGHIFSICKLITLCAAKTIHIIHDSCAKWVKTTKLVILEGIVHQNWRSGSGNYDIFRIQKFWNRLNHGLNSVAWSSRFLWWMSSKVVRFVLLLNCILEPIILEMQSLRHNFLIQDVHG